MSNGRVHAAPRALTFLKAYWGPPAVTGTNDSALPAIIQGFFGSLLLTLGSFGTGWLPLASKLNQNSAFIWLRTDRWGVTLSTLALALGAMLLIRSWLRLGQRLRYWGAGAVKSVAIAVGAWCLPLTFAVPIYSRDVYAYNGQGRLMVEGLNPYQTGISALNNYIQLGADPMWAQTRTPYGPYFLWMEDWVVKLTNAQPEPTVFLFRLLAVIGVGLSAYFACKIAKLHGVDGARAMWIAVANPLTLISFVASAHNDSLMIAFALGAVYFACKHQWHWSILLCALSIGIKPITIIILPFVGLLFAGHKAGWWRKIGCWAVIGFGTLIVLGVSSLPYHLGWGWAQAILDPTPGFISYTPSGFVSNILATLTDALGLPGGSIAEGFRSVVKWVGVLIAAVLIFKGSDRKVVRRLGLAFMAVVMLGPIIQPWYVLWFIPFLAATGIRNDWQIKSWYVVVVFFVMYGAQDQLSVWKFVDVPIQPQVLALTITWLLLAYMLLLDPRTRRILFDSTPYGTRTSSLPMRRSLPTDDAARRLSSDAAVPRRSSAEAVPIQSSSESETPAR